MFCSHCGLQASGNFCSGCGTRLTAGVDLASIVWQQEVRYDVLLQVPEVRERIAASTTASQKRLTGEEFLELAEKALEPLLGGVPVAKLASLVQPMYARLGVATGKSRQALLSQPPGEAIVGVLCSLATAGQTIKRVQQADDGCMVEAVIPSDWRSFAGELIVSVHRDGSGARIEAAAKIPGQLYDWGKSQQALDRLFGDLHRLPVAA